MNVSSPSHRQPSEPAAGATQAAARLIDASLQELLTTLVGHDLRNPLAAITTTVEVLNRLGPLDEPRQRCLGVITGASARLNRLIADLSDLVLAVGSGIPLHVAPAHLDAVCQAVLRDLRASHPGRELLCRGEGDGLGRWDATRLAQVLTNLVSNALRYGAAGTAIELHWCGSDPDRIWLEVKNQGPTIPPDLLPELCRLVRRGRRPSSERQSLGVGLFLSDHLVRAHGGSLKITSAEGRTIVRLELPRQADRGAVEAALGAR